MKNAMLNVSLILVLSGCNANTGAIGTTSGSGNSTTARALVSTEGCTAASVAGGGKVHCGDGSSAFLSNGMPFKLIDANSVNIGDNLIVIDRGEGEYGVWDNTAGAMVWYDSSTGTIVDDVLLYQTSDCSGQPYAAVGAVVNTGFSNNGSAYLVSGTPVTGMFYTSSDGGSCTYLNEGDAGVMGTHVPVIAYPNADLPVQAALPITIQLITQ